MLESGIAGVNVEKFWWLGWETPASCWGADVKSANFKVS